MISYLGGILRDCGGLVSQLQQHRLSCVPLGHLLVGSCSRGNLVIHLHLHVHGCQRVHRKHTYINIRLRHTDWLTIFSDSDSLSIMAARTHPSQVIMDHGMSYWKQYKCTFLMMFLFFSHFHSLTAENTLLRFSGPSQPCNLHAQKGFKWSVCFSVIPKH